MAAFSRRAAPRTDSRATGSAPRRNRYADRRQDERLAPRRSGSCARGSPSTPSPRDGAAGGAPYTGRAGGGAARGSASRPSAPAAPTPTAAFVGGALEAAAAAAAKTSTAAEARTAEAKAPKAPAAPETTPSALAATTTALATPATLASATSLASPVALVASLAASTAFVASLVAATLAAALVSPRAMRVVEETRNGDVECHGDERVAGSLPQGLEASCVSSRSPTSRRRMHQATVPRRWSYVRGLQGSYEASGVQRGASRRRPNHSIPACTAYKFCLSCVQVLSIPLAREPNVTPEWRRYDTLTWGAQPFRSFACVWPTSPAAARLAWCLEEQPPSMAVAPFALRRAGAGREGGTHGGLIFGNGGRATSRPTRPARPTTDRTTICTGAPTATPGSTLARPLPGARAAILPRVTSRTAHLHGTGSLSPLPGVRRRVAARGRLRGANAPIVRGAPRYPEANRAGEREHVHSCPRCEQASMHLQCMRGAGPAALAECLGCDEDRRRFGDPVPEARPPPPSCSWRRSSSVRASFSSSNF